MTSRQAYRLFLRSEFWRALSAEKRRLVGKCEDCGKRERLQSHHWRYPANWFDTTLDDLRVLCRECHRKAHGFIAAPFMIFRDDLRFSAIIHRTSHLMQRAYKGHGLRPRDEAFLENALRLYPPTRKDSCIEFKVGLVRHVDKLAREGAFS